MKKIIIKKLNFGKMNGLLPVVVQDYSTGAVLMVGFMNQMALMKTIKDGRVVFWSRTKKRLWQKGEESGNFLRVVVISSDCDNDSLLIKVRPEGPTCHTSGYSCFESKKPTENDLVFITELYSVLSSRKKNLPANSYTADLFRSGIDKIVQKVGEEAVETVIAGKNDSKKRLIEESADLIFHWLVLLNYRDIKLSDVVDELKYRRKGMSAGRG